MIPDQLHKFYRKYRQQSVALAGCLLLLPGFSVTYAQSGDYSSQRRQQSQNNTVAADRPEPSAKELLRYEIDAKRMGVHETSKDALPRSREFLRIDSTYYVGWYFEGAYKYEHAADYLGYKNATTPLERALNLIERDYKKQLATRSPDLMTYYPVYRYQVDYTRIAYYLLQCYMNTDNADDAYKLLRRAQKWKFQKDLYLDVYNYLAWLTHRNRFYTSDKYAFLKNSIDENEKLANRYLDSAIRSIVRNRSYNSQIFPPAAETADFMGVYHYKAMLHGYAFRTDSARYYYMQMDKNGYLPHNNYANFLMICGDFAEAEKEYKLSSLQESGDKRLREYIYYSSILELYKADPKRGNAILKAMITANGSTPGYGWYNIALARTMLYDGQVAESERYSRKAEQFKELHIGTTLGPTHYNFSLNLNKLMALQARYRMQQFEHKDWWYSPSVLGEMAALKVQTYMQHFLILNQFAQNPERDRVVYKLFSTESTIAFDQVWNLIGDYSTSFFIKRYEKEVATDKRKKIAKYYKLFLARFHIKDKAYKKAEAILEPLLTDPTVDKQYEKLFIARVYESLALCAKAQQQEIKQRDYTLDFYRIYPQLLPFSELTLNMRLKTNQPENVLIKALRSYAINWVTDASSPAIQVDINFSKSDKSNKVSLQVHDDNGVSIVKAQDIYYKKEAEILKELPYRLFNIGGEEAALEQKD